MSSTRTSVDLSLAPELQDSTVFCQYHPGGHSDPAKRTADHINLHYAANALGAWDAVGKWVAIQLSDGGTDGVVYDSKRDAVRHQFDEYLCCYVRLNGVRMDPCEAEIFLETHRRMYANGIRMADPDAPSGGRQYLTSNRTEERARILDILRGTRRD